MSTAPTKQTTRPLRRVALEGGGVAWTDDEPIDEGDPDEAAEWMRQWQEHTAVLAGNPLEQAWKEVFGPMQRHLS